MEDVALGYLSGLVLDGQQGIYPFIDGTIGK